MKLLFYTFTSLLLILLSYYPTYYHYHHTPPDRTWSGTTFYSDDYAVYLHTIRQGTQGRWSVLDRFTSEPHTGSLLHIYYLLFGKFWGFWGVHPIYSYHLMRLIATCLTLIGTYLFIRQTLTHHTLRISAWLIALFAGPLPGKLFIPSLTNSLPLLSEPEITTRVASQPHHTMGSALMLTTLALFLKSKQTPSHQLSIFIALLILLNSWIEPNTSFATLLVMLATTLYFYLRSRSIRFDPSIFLYITTAAPALLYFRLLNSTEPWKTLFAFDSMQHFNPTPISILSAFGPILPLGLLALFTLKWKQLNILIRPQPLILLLSWVAVFVSLFLFSPLLQINRLRFYHQPFFVPLAILATLTLYRLSHLLPKYPKTLTIILTLLTITITLPTTKAILKSRIHEYDDHSTLVYPAKSHLAAFDYLRHQTNPNDAVLALYEASNLVPFLAGNTVYAGNITETLDYDRKSRQATDFYRNQMEPSAAYDFLKKGKIKYVYLGFQENLGLNPSHYSFLRQIYSGPGAYIFTVE